jgi:hypothetical protein
LYKQKTHVTSQFDTTKLRIERQGVKVLAARVVIASSTALLRRAAL